MVFWNNTSDLCSVLMENNMSWLLLIVFIASYIMFSLIINDKSYLSKEDIIKKQNKAQKYLNKHLYTDQEFFIS